MISFERWRDGFVMTVEGRRILRHSSSSPAIFLGTTKVKASSKKVQGIGDGQIWKNPGACEIINEGPDLTVLEFGSFCTIRISYVDRVLRLRFFPSSAINGGIRIKLGANPKEKLFGAGPSTLYDLKGKKLLTRPSDDKTKLRGNLSVMSSTGTWMNVDGGEILGWNFGASLTDLSCSVLPAEIALGFGNTPAMGIEMLTRHLAGKLGKTVRERLPQGMQSGFFLEEAFAEPLPAGAGRLKSVEDLVTMILSLSLAGKGNVYMPLDGFRMRDAADSRSDAAHALEIAAFGPLFTMSEPENVQDEVLGRRIKAALTIHEMLKPYRDFCSETWVEKGIPVLIHPAVYYPEEEGLWELRDQYMFGPDLLIAPTPEGGARTRRLWLPRDEWIHLWTSRHYRNGATVVDAPEGKPAVFYRKESRFVELFDAIRQKATRF